MIIADTGAILAVIDADDRHHAGMMALYEGNPDRWVLPWAVLPEIDYLLAEHVGQRAEEEFVADLASGAFVVEWGEKADLVRAREICVRYASLRLGLVDAVVMAVAERRRATAIVTVDVRHFGAVTLRGRPKILPRDH